jgi:hypothetical protein
MVRWRTAICFWGARNMRKRGKILLGIAGIIVAYFAWVSRPESGDHAERTDTCTFPGITNAQFRDLVVEAKGLIEPERHRIADGAGNIKMLSPNPPLRDVAVKFIVKSQSTVETLARVHAFGRALDARVHDAAPAPGYQYPGPSVIWSERDSEDRVLTGKRLRVWAEYQGPPGLFRWNAETWFVARLFGRRYESFWLWLWFDVPDGLTPQELMAGPRIVDSGAKKGLLVWPLNSIRWGDIRIENRCPGADRFLGDLDRLLRWPCASISKQSRMLVSQAGPIPELYGGAGADLFGISTYSFVMDATSARSASPAA